MATVLYSSFGTTDPVRGMRDGGLMHIMRFYRPDAVYLFLSGEVAKFEENDKRVSKTFEYIREHWDGYSPKVVVKVTDIEDPSDMDILLEPMNELFQQAVAENPGAEILLNLSSGTPQMEIILSQLAMDPRYPTRGIQVKNPERKAGTTLRNVPGTPGEKIDFDLVLEMNEDDEPDPENRCREPKLTAMRREAVRNQLTSLLSQRNYAAIAQMGADLPAPLPKLAKHLAYRSRFQLAEAEAEGSGLLPGLGLPVGRGVYSVDDYEMLEFFAMLKNLVYLKRYTDFVLRVNPFVIRLQLLMLKQRLQPLHLQEHHLIRRVRNQKKLSRSLIQQNLPAMIPGVEAILGFALEDKDVSIKVLNAMLEYLGEDNAVLDFLAKCEKLNKDLRNSAAHSLFSVSNDEIKASCGLFAEGMVQGLERELVRMMAHYADQRIGRRINIYDHADQRIRELARL